MINIEKDINKKAIVLVRDKRTGRLLWRNFGFRIAGVNGNGRVTLISEHDGRTTDFHIREVRAIDR